MKKAPKRTGPSRMSLREMPEVDLKDGRWRPNPYAARIAAEGIKLPKPRTPKKGARRLALRSPGPSGSRLASPRQSNLSRRRTE